MMEEIQRKLDEAVRRLLDERQEAIEDALAGLLAAGVPKEEIKMVNHMATGHVGILVRGVEKYRFSMRVHGALAAHV
ncbi:MAG: hypothetical protein AAF416_14455 [Pseudomonadota bacterium]